MAYKSNSFDNCGTLIIPLECDTKEVDCTVEPVYLCNFTSASRIPLTRTIDAVTKEGGRTDYFCAERPARTIADGYQFSITTCNEVPEAYELFNYATVTRDNMGMVNGYRALSREEGCSSCVKSTGSNCRRKVAIIHFRQHTCSGKSHEQYDFEAYVWGCVEFLPSDQPFVTGKGFAEDQTFTANAEINPNFFDEYGFITMDNPLDVEWCVVYFNCPEGSTLEEMFRCICSDCQRVAAEV